LVQQSRRRNGQRKFPGIIMRDSHFGKNSKPRPPEARAPTAWLGMPRFGRAFNGLTLLPPLPVADRRTPGTPGQPASVNAVRRFPSGLL